MWSKPDFTQKLLNDLRLRKERMTGAQTSDAFRGSSRGIFKQSKGAKTTIGQKNGSTQRSFTSSNTTSQQSVNQIVSYGGGQPHSAQKGNISMAISYAFDNGGNLKAFQLKSNAATVNLLQQIGKRSMQQTSNVKSQSTNEFPTLAYLHIDEVARGAQKLNQILKACTGGLNIEKGSVEVGKELWKGAKELEQSLRMLVSLQEASNSISKPQSKTRLKLLEEGEDFDDNNGIPIVKQNQVVRPVFSFDKPSKNAKGSMNSKGSHRRSASCGPEFHQQSQITSSEKPKQNPGRLPNVIAKLMGLEEVPQNVDSKLAMEVQRQPKHKSSELVLRSSHGNSIECTKIAIMTAKTHELKEEKPYKRASMTDNCSYGTTLDPQISTWKEERVGIGNCVRDSQEAIYKVNKLLSQMAQLRGGDTNREVKITTIAQKQQGGQGAMHTSKTFQKTVEVEKRSSKVPHKMQALSTSTCNNREAGDGVTNKPSLDQRKKKMDIELQPEMLPSVEPQGKKLRSEKNVSPHTANNKSQQRKNTAHSSKPNNLKTAACHSKNMKKHQKAGLDNADVRYGASNNDLATESASTNSNFKEKNLTDLEKGQNGETDLQACTSLNIEAKSVGALKIKQKAELASQRRKPSATSVKASEIMAKTVKTAVKTINGPKPLKQMLHGQRPKKLEKPIVSREAAQPSHRSSKSRLATEEPRARIKHEETQETEPEHMETTNHSKQDASYSLRDNDEHTASEPCTSPEHEETQEAKSEPMSTTNHPKRDESCSLQDFDELTPSDKSEFTASIFPDIQQSQQLVADEDHKVKPQNIATDGQQDGAYTSYNQLQEEQTHSTEVKQEPLTEDQMNLKQTLIQSHLFLKTAEALFKLHIPIGILNYASDQINQDKDGKLILDCGYELLKRKGRRKEMSLYPHISKVMRCTEVGSLDNLVRQMLKDFETLRSYGRSERDEYAKAEYLLKMLERDIFYRVPDLNCMWDLGWNETVFAYTDADEVIKDVKQSLLNDLLGEIVADWF